jgi:hypothetical protein
MHVACNRCSGEGWIITCWDDMCIGTGHCIHGDGEEICPDCFGEGGFDDDEIEDCDDD